jgi:hypothetical protein
MCIVLFIMILVVVVVKHVHGVSASVTLKDSSLVIHDCGSIQFSFCRALQRWYFFWLSSTLVLFNRCHVVIPCVGILGFEISKVCIIVYILCILYVVVVLCLNVCSAFVWLFNVGIYFRLCSTLVLFNRCHEVIPCVGIRVWNFKGCVYKVVSCFCVYFMSLYLYEVMCCWR